MKSVPLVIGSIFLFGVLYLLLTNQGGSEEIFVLAIGSVVFFNKHSIAELEEENEKRRSE